MPSRGGGADGAWPPRTQLTVVAVAAAVVAGALWLSSCAHRREAPAVAKAEPTDRFTPTREQQAQIQTAVATAQAFSDALSTDGRIAVDDERTTQVFPPFTGRVTQVFVAAGEHVRAGQPLAAFAANELVQAQSDLATADAAEAQATTQLAQARSNLARQTVLAPAQAAAQRDVEQARTDLATAEQALATAKANAAAARGRLQVLNVRPDLAATQARVKSGRAAPSAVIRAPIDGVVTSRQVGVGQFVNSYTGGGSTPLLVVSDLSRVWLVANLRDADAARVHVGDMLTARIPALDGRAVSARVIFVSPVVDPAAHRVAVRAEVANPDGRLRPDMFADVVVQAGPARTAVSVPASAVIYDGAAAKVWVEGAGGAYALRQVRVGRTEGGAVEVLGGLAAGERVASGGALFIDQAATGG